jgi:hypothetical protein
VNCTLDWALCHISACVPRCCYMHSSYQSRGVLGCLGFVVTCKWSHLLGCLTLRLTQAIKFLQQAVGLRGYAAKDPLTEFKLEG